MKNGSFLVQKAHRGVGSLSFIFFLGILIAGSSCSSHKAPSMAFQDITPPPRPDYSLEKHWAALPSKEDFADKTPPGVETEQQGEASVDVFYIHPTTYYNIETWNGDVNDVELNKSTDKRPVMHQASAFNASAKVYAPRYRQMVYGGYFAENEMQLKDKARALDLAYQDVKRSFEYYLEHYNQDRPIIIASHSQGTYHSVRLLADFFDGKTLQKKLVAAYVLGMPFKPSRFEELPICESPGQTGCVIHWATWRNGEKPASLNSFYKDAVVVNPLTWTTDQELADKEMHQGFLAGSFKKIKKRKLFAQRYQGILWVRKPFFITPVKNLHIGDYNLFWMDIRKNVALRVKNYLGDG